MKLPDWNKQYVRWDQYEAFHMGLDGKRGLTQTGAWMYPTFVIFDDGQLWCRLSHPDPHDRHDYPELNVTLVSSNDKACPTLFTPDGEQVKKAWLNDDGMQCMLIDHDSGRAVRLAGHSDKIATTLPIEKPEACIGAWFASDKELPVGAPIALRRPFKSLSVEDQKQLDDFTCATRAAMQMLDHPSSKLVVHNYPAKTHTSTITGKPYTVAARTWTEAAPKWKLSIARALEVGFEWERLDDNELKRLFFAGIADRPRELCDYLTVG
jgi:hypothetical protein